MSDDPNFEEVAPGVYAATEKHAQDCWEEMRRPITEEDILHFCDRGSALHEFLINTTRSLGKVGCPKCGCTEFLPIIHGWKRFSPSNRREIREGRARFGEFFAFRGLTKVRHCKSCCYDWFYYNPPLSWIERFSKWADDWVEKHFPTKPPLPCTHKEAKKE